MRTRSKGPTRESNLRSLEYTVKGDRAAVRVHPGARSLRGALASNKGKNMSFGRIRRAAAKIGRAREKSP
jgi:hypothetical protein